MINGIITNVVIPVLGKTNKTLFNVISGLTSLKKVKNAKNQQMAEIIGRIKKTFNLIFIVTYLNT